VTDAPGAIQDQAISGIPDLYISSEPQKDMSETGYENFSIISLNVSEIEWLYLHHSGNRRARIKLTDTAYDFTWLIP
jgi:hypothetical protein